jgi:nucleotide-binding universal stress UspA family protein
VVGPGGDERRQAMIRAEVGAVAYTESHDVVPEPARLVLPATGRASVVVVGVDPEEGADAALTWAVREALGRESHVLLVGVGQPEVDVPLAQSRRPQQRRRLEELASRLREEHPALSVTTELLEGGAGPALVERSRGAELLVVGTHGRAAVSRALLGSVSTYCTTHAHCPTTVVPRGWTPRTG